MQAISHHNLSVYFKYHELKNKIKPTQYSEIDIKSLSYLPMLDSAGLLNFKIYVRIIHAGFNFNGMKAHYKYLKNVTLKYKDHSKTPIRTS